MKKGKEYPEAELELEPGEEASESELELALMVTPEA
jgi:hypothetical protein